jgi:nucleotide-binding universal stress UspA family protein
MYQRILLAYDGSVEGRSALREGALLALCCNADVFLLSVAGGSAGVQLAESAYAGAIDQQQTQLKAIFDEGVGRLKLLGFSPVARFVTGDPAEEIKAFAKEVGADLVVVGHRRRSLLERWWAGSSGAFLSNQIDCSLLVSRNTVSDAEFDAAVNSARTPSLSGTKLAP